MRQEGVVPAAPGSFRTSRVIRPGVQPYPRPLILFKQPLLFEVAGLACTVSVDIAFVAGHLEGHG